MVMAACRRIRSQSSCSADSRASCHALQQWPNSEGDSAQKSARERPRHPRAKPRSASIASTGSFFFRRGRRRQAQVVYVGSKIIFLANLQTKPQKQINGTALFASNPVDFDAGNAYSGSARKPFPRISELSMMLTKASGSMVWRAERSLIMSVRFSVT